MLCVYHLVFTHSISVYLIIKFNLLRSSENMDETNHEENDSFEVPIIVKVETKSTHDQSDNNTSIEITSRTSTELGIVSSKAYKCKLCSIVFQNRFKFSEHQVVHNEKHPCPSCPMTYDQLSTLNAHIESVHSNNEPTSYIPSNRSPMTTKKTSSNVNSMHPSASYTHTTKLNKSEEESLVDMDDKVKCRICSKYVDENLLQAHLRMHRRTSKTFTCDHCPFTTLHLASLNRHIQCNHLTQHEHQCSLCSASFQRLFNLTSHVASVHNSSTSKLKYPTLKRKAPGFQIRKHLAPKDTKGNPLQCPYCPRVSKKLGQLRLHLRVHSGEKPFKCKLCPHRTTQRGALRRHVEDAHGRNNPFKCPMCSASYLQRQNLAGHIDRVHGTKSNSQGLNNGTYAIEQALELAKSVEDKKKQKKPPRPAVQDKINKLYINSANRSAQAQTSVKCTQCPYKTGNIWALKTHEDFAHSEQQANQCKYCSASYRRLQNLEYHIRKVHPEASTRVKGTFRRKGRKSTRPLKAPKNEVLQDKNAMPILEKQLDPSTSEKLDYETPGYFCSICKVKYDRKSQFDIHMRIHSPTKPYYCKNCSYFSKDKSQMKVHMESIHKEKASDYLSTSGSRDVKMEDSNREMPKLVPEIDLSSTETESMSSSTAITCPVCFLTFKKRRYLDSHSVVHSGKKPFSCRVCSTRYARKGELVRHLKSYTHQQMQATSNSNSKL